MILNKKIESMLKSILELGNVTVLNKKEQTALLGGNNCCNLLGSSCNIKCQHV